MTPYKKKKLEDGGRCACISPKKWDMVKVVTYLSYGAVMIIPAFIIETWLITLTGATLLFAVSVIAPIIEETLKALPILAHFTTDFKDRLRYIIIVGFMFGSAEWLVYFFTTNQTLTYGFVLHIVFMLPLLIGYNEDNPVQNYFALALNMLLHMAWNIAVLGGLVI